MELISKKKGKINTSGKKKRAINIKTVYIKLIFFCSHLAEPSGMPKRERSSNKIRDKKSLKDNKILRTLEF